MRTCDPSRGQLILDSAAQLFAKHHYHEVRMDDIAAQAGVAKGTLYRYFADKEDLYLALTVDGMQRLFVESQQRIGGPGQPEERLRSFITGIVRFYENFPYFLELLNRVETSRSAASVCALQSMRKQYLALLTGLVKEIDASGRYSVNDPEMGALALMGISRLLLRTLPQPWPEHMIDWIYNQFLFGLSGPPTDT
jgi:AcrR family transcriptional regulator